MFDSILFYSIRNQDQNLILLMRYTLFTIIWVRIFNIFHPLRQIFFSPRTMAFFHRYHRRRLTFSLIFFYYLITYECDLSFGSLLSLAIQTQAFVFSPFGEWQGDSGPLGGLPVPKTTTATTLTNTVTTTTTTKTIAGRQKRTQERATGPTVTWHCFPTQRSVMWWQRWCSGQWGQIWFLRETSTWTLREREEWLATVELE